MNNDKYKNVTIISLIILFVGVIIYKQAWIILLVLPVTVYTYYKRLQVIPKNERLKAVLPTAISIILLLLMSVYYGFYR